MKKPQHDLAILNSHSYGLWYVGRLFDRQAQPVNIIDIDKTGFTLDFRANLNSVQLDRLIVKAINEKMSGYNAIADHKNRKLMVTLIDKPKKARKSATNSGEDVP